MKRFFVMWIGAFVIGLPFVLIPVEAQKRRSIPDKDVIAFLEKDNMAMQEKAEKDHEAFAIEHEQRLIAEAQLRKLRAKVAEAAKL
jgi:hypothetical protein